MSEARYSSPADRARSSLRVTLVQAPKWTIYTPPYALALLAGNLRSRGFTVTVRDFDVRFHAAVRPEHKPLWLDSSGAWWDRDDQVEALAEEYAPVIDSFVAEILATEPQVVGFSTKLRSRVMTLLLARKLKALRPEVLVILGGPEINDGVKRFLEPYPYVDAVCAQEADLSLPEFLEAFLDHGRRPQPVKGFAYRGEDGGFVDCGPIASAPCWDHVPFADYSDFDFTHYEYPNAITMMLSRGCINRCSFCSEAPSFLRFRPLPAQRVYDEILHLARTSNVRRPMRIFFNDSLLNGDLETLERFADLLLERPIPGGMQFSGMMLVREKMTDELVRKLARAGMVETLFGLETGSTATIRRMRKRFDPADAERILRVASEAGIRVAASIIFGHPGETEIDYYDTIAFMKRIAPHVDGFLLNTLGLFGDSGITRELHAYGIDPARTDPMRWVGDAGANTYEVRRNRMLNALTLFRDKVSDIGGFGDGALDYDPVQPLRERLQAGPDHIAEALRLVALFAAAMPPEAGSERLAGYIDRIARQDDGALQLEGWAIEPATGRSARHVVLQDGTGRVLGYAVSDLPRPDVALATVNPLAKRSGWQMRVSREMAAKVRLSSLAAFAYDPERGCRYRLVVDARAIRPEEETP